MRQKFEPQKPAAERVIKDIRRATRKHHSAEVKALRKERRDLKEALANLTLENRLLKKSMIADGGDDE